MVGLEPTTPKKTWPVDDAICYGISGVVVRLTTCKRSTNSLPKLSLIPLTPLSPKSPKSHGFLVLQTVFLSALGHDIFLRVVYDIILAFLQIIFFMCQDA